MHTLDNKKALFNLLTQGATLVTPNNRLSASLLQEYFLFCNKKTLDKPVCLPYNTFLTNTYQQLQFLRPQQNHPILLNNTQCQHLWRNTIKSDPNLNFSEGLLKTVVQAWEHSEQWQINPKNPAFHYTPQTQQFQRWWQFFNKQLKSLGAINEYQLVPYFIHAQCTSFSHSLIWASFNEFCPQQISLQNYVTTLGVTQYQYDLKEHAATAKVLPAKDNNEEYQQLISWLHLQVEQDHRRIGVVIPNLEQESSTLQRMLVPHFDAKLLNISLGKSLGDFPLVAHALAWLTMDNTLNTQQSALLLQSPYLGGAKEEFIARSQYLQDSVLLHKHSCSLKNLATDLKSFAPKLSELLKQIIPYPEKATPQEWIGLFQERLNTLGFPGNYGLDSKNYQCFHRFTTLFDEFRQLQFISPTLHTKEALDAFTHLTTNTIFQPQKTNAPIQILGLLEASGCEFDSLWVMGLTDQCLPQKTRLSPFIPIQLQRELLMPHSTADKELYFAQQTLQRLQRGSTTTVFSYPQWHGDSPNLPCALLRDFPKLELLPLRESQDKTSLIDFEESYEVPLNRQEPISGGTALLANQAKCPFKAFAEHRLKAQPIEQASDGLDSKENGKIVHKIMELLWSQLKDQQNLCSLPDATLHEYIEQAIHTTLEPFKKLYPQIFSSLVQEVELTRLKRLVFSLLEWEKQRPPFSVEAIEHAYTINLAGIDFKVRVDRLDAVENKKWVIDYKSSLPASKPWNEERPKEPQLLLYALLNESINTLLLIQLKAGKTLCYGLSEEKLDIAGITSLKKEESWERYRQQWQKQLTLLAEEFQQGHCPPEPVNISTCQQCHFQSFCRFQPG